MSDKTRPSIAFIGECMVETRHDLGDQAFAGDTLNTAVYLSRLLPTGEYLIHYITALGVDPLSVSMIKYFVEEGIECEKIRRFSDKNRDHIALRSMQMESGRSNIGENNPPLDIC